MEAMMSTRKKTLTGRVGQGVENKHQPAASTGFSNERSLIAVAVSASSSAPGSAATTTAATTAIFARTSLVDGQRSPLKVLAIECVNCGLSSVSHFDKPETTRFSGLAIHNDLCRGHRAVLAEQLAQVIGSRLERQISDVQILTHCHPLRAPEGSSSKNQL